MAHKLTCKSGNSGDEWFGSQNPANPDNERFCDECGAIIPADDAGMPDDPTTADVFRALANHFKDKL